MNLWLRIIISFFILCIGFYYLIDKTEESIRPRYMETIEESLNDTTHVLSAIVEEEIKKIQTIGFN